MVVRTARIRSLDVKIDSLLTQASERQVRQWVLGQQLLIRAVRRGRHRSLERAWRALSSSALSALCNYRTQCLDLQGRCAELEDSAAHHMEELELTRDELEGVVGVLEELRNGRTQLEETLDDTIHHVASVFQVIRVLINAYQNRNV